MCETKSRITSTISGVVFSNWKPVSKKFSAGIDSAGRHQRARMSSSRRGKPGYRSSEIEDRPMETVLDEGLGAREPAAAFVDVLDAPEQTARLQLGHAEGQKDLDPFDATSLLLGLPIGVGHSIVDRHDGSSDGRDPGTEDKARGAGDRPIRAGLSSVTGEHATGSGGAG
jgi:hypothetical protein